jgi:hypothetical protein
MITYETLLVITPVSGVEGFGLTQFCARGISQTLEPITGPGSGGSVMGTWVRRDINGTAVSIAKPQFRKYASTITCRDVEAPNFDNAWLGQLVIVDCAIELNFPTLSGSPGRAVVAGSLREEGHFTFYRPQLEMLVVGISHSHDEYPHDYNWKLDLIER